MSAVAKRAVRSGPTFVQRSRRTSPTDKAVHQHKTRPFLGLTDDEAKALGDRLLRRITGRITRGER